jgi:hypothetical protein
LSPYVALYFALAELSEDTTEPAAVYGIRYTLMSAVASESLDGSEIREVLPGWFTSKNPGPLRFHEFFDAAFKDRKPFAIVAPVQPFVMNQRLAVQQGMFLCPFTLDVDFEDAIVNMVANGSKRSILVVGRCQFPT